MKTFPIDLMTLTNHIHTQYDKILHNNSFRNRMCVCRRKIFEQFTFTVEKLIIKIGSRTLKYTEDFNFELSTNILELKDWFNKEVYEYLFNDHEVSNKMVLTFKKMQEYQDIKFFDILETKYENILISLRNHEIENVNSELNNLFEEIRAWYELFLYMILSTQFNCQSLKDSFLEDNNIRPDFGCGMNDPTKWCIHHNDCEKCDVHETVLEHGESINIIMVNDFIDDMTWLEKLTDIVKNYHHNPDDITLYLDYRMYDQLIQCKLSHHHYDKILEAQSCFKNIKIKNHEGINFNGYFEKLKTMLTANM